MGNFFAKLKRRHNFRATAAYALVAWVLLQLVNNVAPVLAAESPRRVFLLDGLSASEPAAHGAAEAIKQGVKERLSEDIEVYIDFLDLVRLRGPASENRLVQFLRSKFAQVRPDVVIPISRSAVDFVVQHRDEFAHDIPIVYCCAPALMGDARNIPPDIRGVILESDWVSTFALAQRLQPNARTLVLISGASVDDHRLNQESLGDLQPLVQKYDIKYMTGLPYDELLKQVSRLPRDSIVLLRRVFEDGSGRIHGAELAEDLSKASAAPVYSSSPTYFGSGIVGGRIGSYRSQGIGVADLVRDVLSGKDPSTLPHQTKLPLQYRVDARQLERWGFAESSLPPGTSIEFRQPTLWEQYQKTIILVLLAFAVLVGIIARLLIEIRKRRAAEEARSVAEAEAELRRKEITHMMRVATVGELSGGIAHELGQPLASILANAQAGQTMLANKKLDDRTIGEILEEIVQADTHAGEVVHRLRKLLRKGEHQTALVNLNDLVTATLALLRSELVNRKIKVETELKIDLPLISGDSVQLQQVLLNLMMNAVEAMASTPASKHTLSVGTRTTDAGYVEASGAM